MSLSPSERKQRREEYEKLLRIVDAQTSPTQPALATKSTLRITAQNAGMDGDVAMRRLQAAVENDDVFEWVGTYAVVTEASIERVRDEEIDAGFTRKKLVGKCDKVLQELWNGDREGVDVSV